MQKSLVFRSVFFQVVKIELLPIFYVLQGFCKDLLEVADVLNRAVTGVPEEAMEKESQYLKDVYEGLKLTETQLLQVSY